MEAAAIPVVEETTELTRLEDELFDRIALELWKNASCPDEEADPDIEDTEPWHHDSCL